MWPRLHKAEVLPRTIAEGRAGRLEALAKAQSLALRARIAVELGETSFVAHGFYDHRQKGLVACDIINGWAGMIVPLHEAAGLDIAEEKEMLHKEFD